MDARGGHATLGAARLENGQSFDRAEIKTDRASHKQAKGHLEQTPGAKDLALMPNRKQRGGWSFKEIDVCWN